MGIGLVGALVSVAVVWSYLHALGADRDVEHARAMAMVTLLLASAAITAGLTKLRQAAPRWLVIGTLASLGVFVQVPVLSRFLTLRPLHGSDWALWPSASLVASSPTGWPCVTLALASRLRLQRIEMPVHDGEPVQGSDACPTWRRGARRRGACPRRSELHLAACTTMRWHAARKCTARIGCPKRRRARPGGACWISSATS